VPIDHLASERDQIRRLIRERGFNPHLGSYTAELNGDDVDAVLLLLPWYGFEPAWSRLMQGTLALIQRRLYAGGGLLYRYRSGESPGEGAFGVCGFWLVDFLARGGGTHAEAERLFRELCARQNDVGLYAEEIDPQSGAALGNFPQAFTHIGLLTAARTLAARAEGRSPRARPLPQRAAGRRTAQGRT
jgi:GH15 family glucan-1,4-alpha-glucosidase